jgi:hypothetical protein
VQGIQGKERGRSGSRDSTGGDWNDAGGGYAGELPPMPEFSAAAAQCRAKEGGGDSCATKRRCRSLTLATARLGGRDSRRRRPWRLAAVQASGRAVASRFGTTHLRTTQTRLGYPMADGATWPAGPAHMRATRAAEACGGAWLAGPRPVAVVRLDAAYGARGVQSVPRAGTGSQRRSRGIRTPEDARYDAWQSRNADTRARSRRGDVVVGVGTYFL